MNRREFISFAAAAGAVTAPKDSAANEGKNFAALLRELEDGIRREMPGVTRIEIECRPEDAKMPLMVFAYRD
ncbi:hypothetical protein U8C35_07640 [Sinorhizobium medicae]|uniref:hypothetical protein n=1 Tax=Sinorhizobium medicae TaxID=110321 RepID=UPI002AF6B2B8|nr:hypothetical protein [Sinorhizobium medicae]WQO60283.1 hypothetical protein U8C35_07640 [Sinorhizobium medicae]